MNRRSFTTMLLTALGTLGARTSSAHDVIVLPKQGESPVPARFARILQDDLRQAHREAYERAVAAPGLDLMGWFEETFGKPEVVAEPYNYSDGAEPGLTMAEIVREPVLIPIAWDDEVLLAMQDVVEGGTALAEAIAGSQADLVEKAKADFLHWLEIDWVKKGQRYCWRTTPRVRIDRQLDADMVLVRLSFRVTFWGAVG